MSKPDDAKALANLKQFAKDYNGKPDFKTPDVAFADLGNPSVRGITDILSAAITMNEDHKKLLLQDQTSVQQLKTYEHEKAHQARLLKSAGNFDEVLPILKSLVGTISTHDYPSQNGRFPEEEILAEMAARREMSNANTYSSDPKEQERLRALTRDNFGFLPPEQQLQLSDAINSIYGRGPAERNPQIFRTAPEGAAQDPLLAAIADAMPK